MSRGISFFTCCALVLGACDARSTNDYGSQDLEYPDAGFVEAEPDAMVVDAGPACVLSPPATCGEAAVQDACSAPADATRGSIRGQVVLGPGMPGGGHPASGTLLIVAVEELAGGDGCPSPTDPAPPQALILHCANLTAGATIDFTLEGVPVGSADINVLASLDVNGNGVDACDVAGLARVRVMSAGERVELAEPLELGLSVALFLPAQCDKTCE
jgi:hypothetical protein